jgi:hypothetical protein
MGIRRLIRMLAIAAIAGMVCLRGAEIMADEDHGQGSRYVNFDPAQESRYLFFPITMYVNVAFDSAQVPEAFPQNDYFINHVKLFNEISNPVRAINRDGGWQKLVRDELLSERVLPNITLHLMGGGYEFRTLAEWYDYHGFPVPYLLSFITFFAAEYGNEAIEYNNKVLTSHDPIADLFFFDILGPLIFMNDSAARFFHDVLQLRSWHGQPFFSLTQMKILNASVSYVIRPYLFGETVRPFMYMGMNYFFGASFRVADGEYLSFGAGITVTKPFDPAHDSKQDYLRKIRVGGGIFWDRNDAPLVSLLLNATEQYQFRLNVYPEVLNLRYVNVGFFMAIDDNRHVVWGVSLYRILPMGMTI